MTTSIMYGFDTENPHGERAKSKEAQREREEDFKLVSRLNELMDSYGASRTFFLLGDFLEKSAQALGNEHLRQVFHSNNNGIEFANHTYSHITIDNLPTRPDKIPASPDAFEQELILTNKILKDVFLVDSVEGFRTPYGYSGGIKDKQILDILKKLGFKYSSSSLRDSAFGINAPLLENGTYRQPFFYDNGLLELPSHGWQDNAFTGTSKTTNAKGYPTTKEDIFLHYSRIFSEASRVSGIFGKDFYVGICMHPHSIRSYDPQLEVITKLLDFSAEKGLKTISHRQSLEELARD